MSPVLLRYLAREIDQAEDGVGELRGLQAGVGPELVCCRP